MLRDMVHTECIKRQKKRICRLMQAEDMHINILDHRYGLLKLSNTVPRSKTGPMIGEFSLLDVLGHQEKKPYQDEAGELTEV